MLILRNLNKSYVKGRFGEETGSDEFGASIMIHSVTPATAESSDISVRIENLEITYAGQAFRLGRSVDKICPFIIIISYEV